MTENSKKLQMKMVEILNNYLIVDNDFSELNKQVSNLRGEYKQLLFEKEVNNDENISEVIGQYKFLVNFVNILEKKNKQNEIINTIKKGIYFKNSFLKPKYFKRIIIAIHNNPGIKYQELLKKVKLREEKALEYALFLIEKDLLKITHFSVFEFYLTEFGDLICKNFAWY